MCFSPEIDVVTAMLEGPIGAAVNGKALSYRTGVANGGLVAALYMVSTVGALLASSHRRIATFGLANLVALPFLTLLAAEALTSLWCAWAAVASIVIATHVREAESVTEATDARSRPRPAALFAGCLQRVHFRPP
jgi:hypothetical protein